MNAIQKKIIGTARLAFITGAMLCSLLPAQSAYAQVCQKLVATGNPEYPPYLWRDPEDQSKLIGANADLMQLLAKEIGMPIEVTYTGPWSRVQELSRAGRIDLIAGAFFTHARLDYMDYFYPAFRATRTAIWTNPSKTFNFRTWSDLRDRKGLTVVNNSFGEEFDAYAKKSLNIAYVASLEQALQMLVLSRIDYLIYEEEPSLAIAAKLGITNLKTAPLAVSSESLFVTLSHKSPCNVGKLRGRIAKALADLTKDDAMDALIETNTQLWRKQNKG